MQKRHNSKTNKWAKPTTRTVCGLIGLILCVGFVSFFPVPSAKSSQASNVQAASGTGVFTPTEVSVTASGRIEAHTSVSVMPETLGRVAEIYVDLNEQVQKGNVLVQLHAAEEKARLNVALADLEIAEIQLNIKQKLARQMKAALGESSAIQEAVEAERTNAQTELRLAQDEFTRQKKLQRQGIVSKSRLSEAHSALASANSDAVKSTAGQKAAHFKGEVLQLDYEIALQQVQEAKALLRKAESHLKEAQADIEKTFIRAPIDGLIVAMDLEIGQVVDPRSKPSFLIHHH